MLQSRGLHSQGRMSETARRDQLSEPPFLYLLQGVFTVVTLVHLKKNSDCLKLKVKENLSDFQIE